MVRRFRRRRGGMRRARSFIRRTVANMGPIEAKRLVLDNVTIPARTASDYDNPLQIGLVVCQETVDEEVESTSATIAQVPLYSKVVGLKMNLMIHAAASTDRFRWMLYKRPDGEGLITTGLVDAIFHSSDDAQNNRELRANTLAKGFFVGSDKTAGRLPLFVKRSTLKRLGNLRENDRIELIIAKSGASTANITGFGTTYVRLN